jgi:hypothetical protein
MMMMMIIIIIINIITLFCHFPCQCKFRQTIPNNNGAHHSNPEYTQKKARLADIIAFLHTVEGPVKTKSSIDTDFEIRP